MTTLEYAAVIEASVTAAGLLVVIAGAVFAGMQLRQEAQARRLQALVNLYADVWPVEARRAAVTLYGLPDHFDYQQLSVDERVAVDQIRNRYNRLGYMLHLGLVRGEDIFTNLPFGVGAILAWEKLKHTMRVGDDEVAPTSVAGVETPIPLPPGIHFEFLVERAQAYLLQHGVAEYGNIPVFEADVDALAAMARTAQRTRTTAAAS